MGVADIEMDTDQRWRIERIRRFSDVLAVDTARSAADDAGHDAVVA